MKNKIYDVTIPIKKSFSYSHFKNKLYFCGVNFVENIRNKFSKNNKYFICKALKIKYLLR
jgi:hypothetical protein